MINKVKKNYSTLIIYKPRHKIDVNLNIGVHIDNHYSLFTIIYCPTPHPCTQYVSQILFQTKQQKHFLVINKYWVIAEISQIESKILKQTVAEQGGSYFKDKQL